MRYIFLNDILTCCRNCSRKPEPALLVLGFFLTGGFVGAAAAAAAAKVGNPGWDVGCLAATDESVADADDGSFVVLFVFDVSPHRIRGCFLLLGLDETLLESLQPAASFLRALDLDDIVDPTVLSLKGVRCGFRTEISLSNAVIKNCAVLNSMHFWSKLVEKSIRCIVDNVSLILLYEDGALFHNHREQCTFSSNNK